MLLARAKKEAAERVASARKGGRGATRGRSSKTNGDGTCLCACVLICVCVGVLLCLHACELVCSCACELVCLCDGSNYAV